jgi:hypothetical protein
MALQLHTGTNTAMHQNGSNQAKKVQSPIIILTTVAQDEQLTQFYTDLKASEALHATAATIISGTPKLGLTNRRTGHASRRRQET